MGRRPPLRGGRRRCVAAPAAGGRGWGGRGEDGLPRRRRLQAGPPRPGGGAWPGAEAGVVKDAAARERGNKLVRSRLHKVSVL